MKVCVRTLMILIQQEAGLGLGQMEAAGKRFFRFSQLGLRNLNSVLA